MSQVLIIRHQGGLRFSVLRLRGGKQTNPVELTSPDAIAVQDRPDSNLTQDLRWYLESFLELPIPPNTEVARHTQDALKDWGSDCFSRLFAGQALLWYDAARREGLAQLNLKIASDDPRVLAWPWEALRDPHGSTLAHDCRIERQLSELHDPLPLPDALPEERINILLVIARPYGDSDVGFHVLSRPLIERIEAQGLPVQVDLLRPPSFAQLERRLRQRPGHYHMVHFDGHGGYGEAGESGHPPGAPHIYRGPAQGRLVFEHESTGEPELIEAAKLTTLLAEHRIPIMVLNACQSARIDERADDPFASVAAALLKAGMRSVVAMGYNLYVSGAQQFVPAFYQRLLEDGDVAEATRAGRRAMLLHDARGHARGEHPLQDWLVPVLYQQDPMTLPVAKLQAAAREPRADLPKEALQLGQQGFIGRQSAIQALERAIQRQPQAGILIHGTAGIGKTTLAQGFLHWLQQTNGLGGEPFVGALWFPFEAIRNAEYVVNQLIEALFDHQATALPMEQKLPALTQALREQPLLLVWDNFESAAGIAGTEVSPQLGEPDRQRLKTLLANLRGGKTKVLITSRSPETWLGTGEAYRLPLQGLRGEEQWEYCNALVADLGLHPRRDDKDYGALLDELDGHPLALRAILLRLQERSAAQLLAELKSAFAGARGDPATQRIDAALSLLDGALPPEHGPALQLIGLHRRFVDIDYLAQMLQGTDPEPQRERLNDTLAALEQGGLLQHLGQGVHRMHPALSGFLGHRHPAPEARQRAFVDFMGRLADHLTPKPLYEQRVPFALHGANFHQALSLAKAWSMEAHVYALTQSLAVFAQNNRDLAAAGQLFQALAEHCEAIDDQKRLAAAYHQLGMIAEEQRDFPSAEQRYRESLAISEKQGDEHGAALSYHQLGMIAQKQRDFPSAEQWYRKSLAIFEKQGNEHGAALSYHNLGAIAEEQRDFPSAEQWYRKSLAIKEKQGDEHGAAQSYHQLGTNAQKQRDFSSAGAWYLRAITAFAKLNDPHSLRIAVRSFARNLQAADQPTRDGLGQDWGEAGGRSGHAPRGG